MLVGHLKQIWRYPVKSMGGEVIDSAILCNQGIPGDRCWAVIDTEEREIRSAKRWPELMNFKAALASTDAPAPETYLDQLPSVAITCPDGTTFDSRSEGAGALLASQLQRPASLAPLAPSTDVDHYRLARERTDQSLSEEMGLLPGEAMPDFTASMSDVLASLAEHVTPPGTYFDAFPLHLMTTNSLRYLSEAGGVNAVVERYRPNLLIEPTASLAEMTENNWVECCLQIGNAVIYIESRTVRCSMPAREQQWCELAAEPGMARAMVNHCDRHLGVNVMVVQHGSIEAGDEIHLLEKN
ncbi:MAG: MOSC N-terminal beta barrel domain-containing protein [Halioglobus sp.]